MSTKSSTKMIKKILKNLQFYAKPAELLHMNMEELVKENEDAAKLAKNVGGMKRHNKPLQCTKKSYD